MKKIQISSIITNLSQSNLYKEEVMLKKGKHWTKSKNINSKRYKRDLANYLDGRSLKCVTERIDGIEEVIGKSGAIIKKEDELIVSSSQEVLLRTKIDDLSARRRRDHGPRYRTRRSRTHSHRFLQLLASAGRLIRWILS
mgnify:CR=1 FL=1